MPSTKQLSAVDEARDVLNEALVLARGERSTLLCAKIEEALSLLDGA